MLNPLLIELPDEIHTPRLVLRPFREGDQDAMLEAVEESRTELEAWMPWAPGYQHQHAVEFVRTAHANWLLRRDLPMAITDRATGRFLGGTGLHRIQWDIPAFEVGYWIRTGQTGQGFVTETVRHLIRFAFDDLHGRRVLIRCHRDNVKSSAIPRRLGIPYEGERRNEIRGPDGRVWNLDAYALTREDFADFRRRWFEGEPDPAP
ncbi:MAG: GNAT family N-acetyltransferase [Fimbriimonadaceae bacterium]